MAEIITSPNSNGKRIRTMMPIQVDMTPMVDLGFLLITFFMLAATLSKPNVMDLSYPPKNDAVQNEIDPRNQISFIIGQDNRVFYHQSQVSELSPDQLYETDFNGLNISKIIAEAKKAAPKPEFFTVIIKPTNEASYKNFVDMLDNMAITKSERYGIADIKPQETQIYETKLR